MGLQGWDPNPVGLGPLQEERAPETCPHVCREGVMGKLPSTSRHGGPRPDTRLSAPLSLRLPASREEPLLLLYHIQRVLCHSNSSRHVLEPSCREVQLSRRPLLPRALARQIWGKARCSPGTCACRVQPPSVPLRVFLDPLSQAGPPLEGGPYSWRLSGAHWGQRDLSSLAGWAPPTPQLCSEAL